jgi:hypothetical protein
LLDAGQTLTALGVDESGRPLLGFAGTSGGGSAVVRLTAAGAVDTSFGEDGMSSFPPRPGETGLLPVRRLVPGPGGSVLFSVETRGFSRALRITRLTEAGALDAEAVLLSGVSETKEKLVVEPDGRVVVIKPGVSHYDVLVRLDPRLRPDSTFVPGDDALEALANVDGASGALVDGRLVLASGWRTYPADQAGPVVDAIVRRLDSGPPTSRFVPVTPTRIMDTRTGLGGEKANGGEFRRLQVAGHGGVPATGASAVVLTMTAVDADPGYVTVWSSVGPQPTASNLNMTRAGQVVAAQVVVPIEPDGLISIFTSSSTHLLVDVAGWYEEADAAAAGRLVPVAPSRVLDTRIGIGAPPGRRGADTRVDLDLTGRGGVPATGASAVVLTLTGVGSSPGFLTVWPKGAAQPLASNLNVDHENQTMANHVMVPLGLDGDVSIYTSGGGHVLADVVGWITDPSAPSATSGLFVPLSPVRRLDSRGPIGGSPGRRPAGSVTQLALGGTPGLPTSGVGAVVANVTAVEADPTYLTVWAGGSRQPLASNVNVSIAGDIVPNLVTTPAGPGASLQVFTEGATHLVADVAGWYLA